MVMVMVMVMVAVAVAVAVAVRVAVRFRGAVVVRNAVCMMDTCQECKGTGATPVGGDDEGQTRSVCWKCDGSGKSPANPTQELPENPEQSKPTLPANPTQEGPYRIEYVGAHPTDEREWVIAGPSVEGRNRICFDQDKDAALQLANAAFAAGRAHVWEQIEKRIYPAPPFDTKDWQTEYECLTADLAEMFRPERGFGDPAEGYREMADESLALAESTLVAGFELMTASTQNPEDVAAGRESVEGSAAKPDPRLEWKLCYVEGNRAYFCEGE